MVLTKKHIINSLSIFILAFLFVSDAMVFIGFNRTQKSNCCGAECQCNIDNHCDMYISCEPTRVVILIPLVNIDEKGFDIVEPMDSYTDNIDLKFFEKETHIIEYQTNPILKPPLNLINTPLLI